MTIEKYKRYISNLEDLLIKEQERGKKEDIAFYEWMLDVVKRELCLKAKLSFLPKGLTNFLIML